MPLPEKRKNEKPNQFISRCMNNTEMKKEFPNKKQRLAVCFQRAKKKKSYGWECMEELKKEGRVLSSKNEKLIQDAKDALERLLQANKKN